MDGNNIIKNFNTLLEQEPTDLLSIDSGKDGVRAHIFSADRLEAVARPSSVAGVTCVLWPERGGAAQPRRPPVTEELQSPLLKHEKGQSDFVYGPYSDILSLIESLNSPLSSTFNLRDFWRLMRSITRSYYRNSVGGLLVFDITNRRSFEHVKDWLEEAKMHVQPFQIVFLLVGHKCDLVSQREVTREEAEKLSSDCGMKYIETSAKDATNVEESFTILTRDIYELVKKGEISIQDGWEGVKSGFVPNVVHSSEEAVKPRRQCIC
ncbi:PREDICTED: ras-related protein Rab-39A-like [Cariama cristata]|uniref:ras-related protein Rab-39A-like n=1 Tax=Cariama cristata TaxID=54380 RepID=UPI00051FFAE7|nr:PREDICTED: ras-related protein Rab-39A-like [Cariama cristata]